MWTRFAAVVLAGVMLPACASLGVLRQLIQPPRFSESRDQPVEVRIEPPR